MIAKNILAAEIIHRIWTYSVGVKKMCLCWDIWCRENVIMRGECIICLHKLSYVSRLTKIVELHPTQPLYIAIRQVGMFWVI